MYPNAVIALEVGSDKARGAAAAKLARSEWRAYSPVKITIEAEDSQPVTITLREQWELLYLDIRGIDGKPLLTVQNLVRDALGIEEASDEERESVSHLMAINQRLRKVQKAVAGLTDRIVTPSSAERLRCFVSFRFDEHSKALALELREFIELADLEFVSGLGYEPRSVSEKVLERLSGNVDLFIVISAVGGDSAWLHQEIGVAKGRGIPVMVLREEGTTLDEGLLSDTEYAVFPIDTISGAFIPVLQATRYVRLRQKAK
jgi:hypothetical protein